MFRSVVVAARRAACFATFAALYANPSLAAPLIEDAFDYDVGSLSSSNGGAGWAGPWTVSLQPGVTEGSIDVVEGSLAFSDYETTGNRVNLNLVSGTGFTGMQATRSIGQSVTEGELWSSFLYRRTDDQIGISTLSRTNEIRFNSPAIHFGMKAKGPSSQGIRVRYDVTDSSSAAGTSVQDGETYLMVARFTALGTDDQTGTGTMWALTEDDYNSIRIGGVTPEELDSAATLIARDEGADNVNDEPRTLEIGDTLWMLNYTGSFSSSFDVDELRYGVALADVVPGSSLAPAPGDFNLDGVVDAADYTVWRDNFGDADESAIGNNGNGAGGIDDADYDLWSQNYGEVAGADSSGVAFTTPEPTTFTLWAIGAVGFMSRRLARGVATRA